jgi:hypothetical protein
VREQGGNPFVRRGGAVLALLLALGSCAPSGDGLVVESAGRGSFEMHPGEQVVFGSGPIQALLRPVRVTQLTVRHPPPGVRVVGTWLELPAENNGEEPGIQPGVDFRRLHRAGDVVLDPAQKRWFVVVSVRALRPGRFHIVGFDIEYQSGSSTRRVFARAPFTLLVSGSRRS